MAFVLNIPDMRSVGATEFIEALRRPLEELGLWKIEQIWADPNSHNVVYLVAHEFEAAPAAFFGCVVFGSFPHYLDSGSYQLRKRRYLTRADFFSDMPSGSQDILDGAAPLVYSQFSKP